MPIRLLVWKVLGGDIISITTNVSGTLKTLTEVRTNVSGTLKAFTEVHTNVSGTLKQIFSAIPKSISGSCTTGQSAKTVATDIVVSSSCTVTGHITLSKAGMSGAVAMIAIDQNNKSTNIISTSQSYSTGSEFSGSATLAAGTYKITVLAYNMTSGTTYESPTLTYSVTFS